MHLVHQRPRLLSSATPPFASRPAWGCACARVCACEGGGKGREGCGGVRGGRRASERACECARGVSASVPGSMGCIVAWGRPTNASHAQLAAAAQSLAEGLLAGLLPCHVSRAGVVVQM